MYRKRYLRSDIESVITITGNPQKIQGTMLEVTISYANNTKQKRIWDSVKHGVKCKIELGIVNRESLKNFTTRADSPYGRE